MLVAQHGGGRRLEVAHRAERRQPLQGVVGHVDLPPAEPLARARLIGVVVVVPALAHGEDGQDRVVAGVVAGHIAPRAAHMGQGIDAEGGVVDRHRAPAEADHQAGPAGQEKAQGAQGDRRQQLVSVQPAQLGVARKILDLDQVGIGVAPVENPADVGVEDAALAGRMQVVGGVGIEVVMPVLGRPPQDALLPCALGQRRQQELIDSAGRIGPVGEVAVVAPGHREHAQPIKDDSQGHGLPGDARPDGGETRQVDQDEGNGRRVDDIVVPASAGGVLGRHDG